MTKKEYDAALVELHDMMRQCNDTITGVRKAFQMRDTDNAITLMRKYQDLSKERHKLAIKVGVVVLMESCEPGESEMPGSSK